MYLTLNSLCIWCHKLNGTFECVYAQHAYMNQWVRAPFSLRHHMHEVFRNKFTWKHNAQLLCDHVDVILQLGFPICGSFKIVWLFYAAMLMTKVHSVFTVYTKINFPIVFKLVSRSMDIFNICVWNYFCTTEEWCEADYTLSPKSQEEWSEISHPYCRGKWLSCS